MTTIPHVRRAVKRNRPADLAPLFDALADVAVRRDVPGPTCSPSSRKPGRR